MMAFLKRYAASHLAAAGLVIVVVALFAALFGPWLVPYDPGAQDILQSTPRLQDLVSDGIIELDGASLIVPESARLLVRSVAAAFDTHLDRSQRLHSRAI